MATTLIVLAHPEPCSFNGAWAAATKTACLKAGGDVLFSDLVGMAFDPVEARHHYPHLAPDAHFDPLKAQETASATNRLPTDVVSEISKLHCADRVVFHFPIWWFSPPAILKGWFDRVLSHGETHSVTDRFDTGRFLGRKALFCVTTGSSASESAYSGKEGDIQMLLWPLAFALRYVGYSVLVPEIVHGVHGYHSGAQRHELKTRLRNVLDGQQSLIDTFDERPEMPFNSESDFDAAGRLKPDKPSYSPFIRHDPKSFG